MSIEYIEHNAEKAKNLRELVAQYEYERSWATFKRMDERSNNLGKLELSGLESLEKYVQEEDKVIQEINDTMVAYYKNLFNQKVKDYHIFDLAAQLYESTVRYTGPKKPFKPIQTKYQLRQVVNSFNNQHHM